MLSVYHVLKYGNQPVGDEKESGYGAHYLLADVEHDIVIALVKKPTRALKEWVEMHQKAIDWDSEDEQKIVGHLCTWIRGYLHEPLQKDTVITLTGKWSDTCKFTHLRDITEEYTKPPSEEAPGVNIHEVI